MKTFVTDVSKPIILREFIWNSIPEEEKVLKNSMVLVSRRVARQTVSFFHPCTIISNLCTLEEVYRILSWEIREFKPGLYLTLDSGTLIEGGTAENLWSWLDRKGYVPKARVPHIKKGDRVLTVHGMGIVVNRDGRWGIKLDHNPLPNLFKDGILYFFESEILGRA